MADTRTEETPNSGPWWVIHEEAILEALHRTHDGEDPDLVYAELYANSEHRSDDEEGIDMVVVEHEEGEDDAEAG